MWVVANRLFGRAERCTLSSQCLCAGFLLAFRTRPAHVVTLWPIVDHRGAFRPDEMGYFKSRALSDPSDAPISVPDQRMESAMLRDQAINFLQAIVVFLLLTNAASVVVTAYAMRLVNAMNPKAAQATSAIERKIEAMVSRPT
jgi:hypothetical protein